MNDTLKVGQRASRTASLTEDHVRAYSELTGIAIPCTTTPRSPRARGSGSLIVQGGLTTGLLHALVAMDLPGPGTVFLEQNWRFTNPVFIGDTITAAVEVLEVHESKPVSKLGVLVTRQTGETVLEGYAWCYRAQPA